MSRRIIKNIPAKVLRDAQIKLDEVLCLLKPYLVALTQAEREALIKIESESINFLEVSHGIAAENPALFPTFMKMAVFREEFSTAHELWLFISKINQLKEDICDTGMLAGNYALETALAFYHTVKIAAMHDIPGARIIYEELKPAFHSRKRKIRKLNTAKNKAQPELFDQCELNSLRTIT